jgi:tRNA dimethylallyltransferase
LPTGVSPKRVTNPLQVANLPHKLALPCLHVAPNQEARPLVAIVGPTGSGKSTLAVRLAEEFGGEVVNCDSLQLYRGFNIGTAKIPESERHKIPHHMIDVLEPPQVYSAGDYARRAREVINQISARGRLPVIAGGTGFYLKALLSGLPQLPERNHALRVRLATREEKRSGSLHRLLMRLDPAAAARIHSRDIQKIIRALEVRMLTRNPLPAVSAAEPLHGYRTLQIGLDPERAVLYNYLDARTLKMFRSGLVEEVKGLLDAGCTGREKPFESLGYRQALACIQGSMTIEQAIASTQVETRQYAKRQWTWFRRDPQTQWLSGFGDSAPVIEKCFDMFRNFIRLGAYI